MTSEQQASQEEQYASLEEALNQGIVFFDRLVNQDVNTSLDEIDKMDDQSLAITLAGAVVLFQQILAEHNDQNPQEQPNPQQQQDGLYIPGQ